MDEFSAIKQYVAQYIHLTAEEEASFTSLLRVTRVKKKQWIVQPDFTCAYQSFIVKGVLRAYVVDSHAQEHTVALGVENWWSCDIYSYIHQVPATQFIEALEDSVLLQLSYHNELLLLSRVPKFERLFRLMAQTSFAALQRRMVSNLSKTAEERYDEYVAKYPAIARRVPQYILASYLGISTAFLSKIKSGYLKS